MKEYEEDVRHSCGHVVTYKTTGEKMLRRQVRAMRTNTCLKCQLKSLIPDSANQITTKEVVPSRLDWARYGKQKGRFKAEAGMGGRYVVVDFDDYATAILEDHPDEFYAEAVNVDEAKSQCESDWLVRLDTVARANGYVKLEDNERVLPVEAIRRLAHPYCATCREEGLGDCKTCEITALIGGCHD